MVIVFLLRRSRLQSTSSDALTDDSFSIPTEEGLHMYFQFSCGLMSNMTGKGSFNGDIDR